MAVIGTTAIGIVSYNGYTFDGAFHAEVNGEQVPDAAGRTTKFWRYTLTVRAIIADDGGSDTEMAEIRLKLSQQGKTLRFVQKGFGNPLHVGVALKRDMEFGPIPKVISWTPIAGSNACEVTWQCVFHIAECQDSVQRDIIEANYSVQVNIDSFGNTTRIISGHVTIANYRIGTAIANNPDLFRSFIKAAVPLGFRRTQTYSVNEAKTRVDFVLTDTEIPTHHNSFPEFMVDARGRHRVQWNRRAGHAINSLDLTLQPRANVRQLECWIVALGILQARIGAQLRAKGTKGKPGVLIDSLAITEDLWGRPVEISVTWRHFHQLRDLVLESGLFGVFDWRTKAQLANPRTRNIAPWQRWRTAMAPWAHSPHGNANWSMSVQDDRIVDICSPRGGPVINDRVRFYQTIGAAVPSFTNQRPPADQSYVNYELDVAPVFSRAVVRQDFLQDPEEVSGVTDMNASVAPRFGRSQDDADDIESVVQQAGQHGYAVVVRGKAERAGHRIPRFKLDRIGERAAVEVAGAYKESVVKQSLGTPVYMAQWILKYAVGGTLGALRSPRNVRDKVGGNLRD